MTVRGLVTRCFRAVMINTVRKSAMTMAAAFRRLRRRPHSADPPVPLEEVIVFDAAEEMIFRAKLPRQELYDHLGRNARYVPATLAPRFIGAFLGWTVATLIAIALFTCLGMAVFRVWIHHLHMGWWILSGFLGTLLGLLLGTYPGWEVGPRFGPKVQWLAVRDNDGRILPLDPSERVAPNDPRANWVYEFMLMREEKQIVSGGASTMQRLVLGTMAVLVGGLAFALFMFANVFIVG